MFTIVQVQQAHSEVKSGADFPAYIQALKSLGVSYYETYVGDGHTDYFGANHYQINSPAKYPRLSVAATCNLNQFKADLNAHQQGQTDYHTFCGACAQSGIDKWAVSLEELTCTYYDVAGGEVWLEAIPA